MAAEMQKLKAGTDCDHPREEKLMAAKGLSSYYYSMEGGADRQI
jgi:hypothetical protein